MLYFDLTEITHIIRLMGVNAELGEAGGVFTIHVGELADDLDGTPRHTVAAGPGWRTTTKNGWRPIGKPGEFGFNQDTPDHPTAYVVRPQETSITIAERIVRLHHVVQARRDERNRLATELAELPTVVAAIPGEDVGGRVYTSSDPADWDAVFRAAPGAVNLICDQETYPDLFQKLVFTALSDVLEDGPVEDAVVSDDGGRTAGKLTMHQGTVDRVDQQDGVVFHDGFCVPLSHVVALKF